jgi:heat shock protein HslJ
MILLVVVALSVMAAGCSSPSSPSFNADDIEGTWMLQSIVPAGGPEQAAPVGATYSLTLTDDRVSTRADCNVCTGSVAVNGHTLTLGPQLACTRAACPTMAFENVYVSLLAGDSTPQFDSNTLTLTSSRGVLRFRR